MNINHTLSIVLWSSVSVALTEVFISFPVKMICIFNVNLYERKNALSISTKNMIDGEGIQRKNTVYLFKY